MPGALAIPRRKGRYNPLLGEIMGRGVF